MKAIAISFLIASLSLSASCYAKGVYTGLVWESQDIDLPSSSVSLDVVGLVGGYQFNKYFSVEGRVSTGVNDDTLGVVASQGIADLQREIDLQTSLSLKVAHEFENGINVFALAGYADTTLDSTVVFEEGNDIAPIYLEDSTSGLMYGVGLGYEFSPYFQIAIEYRVLPDYEVTINMGAGPQEQSYDWDSISVAVSYRF